MLVRSSTWSNAGNPFEICAGGVTVPTGSTLVIDGASGPVEVNALGSGGITVGETVAEAFVSMYYLEASCAIQVKAQAGGELIVVPKDIIESAYAQMTAAARPRGARGSLVWPGLLRRIDRIDQSYRN